jgi:hypothetical protein
METSELLDLQRDDTAGFFQMIHTY